MSEILCRILREFKRTVLALILAVMKGETKENILLNKNILMSSNSDFKYQNIFYSHFAINCKNNRCSYSIQCTYYLG